MRKTFIIFILLFIAIPTLHAQIHGIPEDSISVYLSQKWKEKARFLDKQQIAIYDEAIVYKFKADNTFIKKIDNKTTKGSWNYDRSKKVVQLVIDTKTDFYVVALNKNELLLSAELHEEANKGLGILVLLKRTD